MVKSVVYTLTALALCLGLFIFTDWFLSKEFGEFYVACDSLYDKLEQDIATCQDATALKTMWESKKSKLHIFIPHNDVSTIEHTVNELCGLIASGQTTLAISKTEILKGAALALPAAYSLRLENIF